MVDAMPSKQLSVCIAFTVLVLATCWLYSVPCEDKVECVEMKKAGAASKQHHAFMALGLGILFIREAVGLTGTLRELYETKEKWGTRRSCPPVFLLCVILGVLTTVELVFWRIDMPWSHAMHSVGGMTEAWRPIHSFRYFEWLINVPCLIVLAGNCSLARPMEEVIPPLVITNCYVLWAWAAQVTPDARVRAFLVLMTFVGYSWASWIMCVQWVKDFLLERPFNGRSQFLRLLVPIGLTLLLIAYAVIYLTGISGIISADTELKGFTYAGFFCKVGFSAVFAYFRWVEDRQNLATLMGKVRSGLLTVRLEYQFGTMNTTLFAILKSTFDILVSATVAEDGSCTLAAAKTSDAAELERVLQRPAAGKALHNLLSGEDAKQQFSLYAKNVVQQAELAEPTSSPLENAVLDPACKTPAPIAQVLHCAMRCGEEDADSKVRAKVHISPVPKSLQSVSTGKEVIVAIAFDTMEQGMGDLPIDEAAMNMDEAATLPAGEVPVELLSKKKKLTGKMLAKEGKIMDEDDDIKEQEAAGKPRRRRALGNKSFPPSEDMSTTTERSSENTTGVSGSGPNLHSDLDSVYSTETVDSQVLGGSDVGSQPSKQSYVGSVHMATRQLLGPLMDTKAPGDVVSQRMEDHMAVAAEMVQLQAPAAVQHYRYKQEMVEWKDRQKNQALANILEKQQASGGIDDTVWFSEILPRVRGPAPGRKPKEPTLPSDPQQLWQKAHEITFEDDEEDEDDQ